MRLLLHALKELFISLSFATRDRTGLSARNAKRLVAVLILISVCLLIGLATYAVRSREDKHYSLGTLERAYYSAVLRAQKLGRELASSKLVSKLIALRRDNPTLKWTQESDFVKRRQKALPQQTALTAAHNWVLLVTWTNYDPYRDYLHKNMFLSRDVWVTAVPEVPINTCC